MLKKMMQLFLVSFWIGIILLGGGEVLATDTPFIYDGTSWVQAENLPQLGTTINNNTESEIFDQHVEPNNDDIVRLAMDLAIEYPGGYRAGQITEIYDYMINGDANTGPWCYVDHQPDYYMYAHQILKDGISSGCSGRGNSNDFAILMASLMDAAGYSTRIVHAYHQQSGHAYAEVYLGTKGPQVDAVVKWLNEHYRKKIYLHINNDPNSQDVWLNLDWQSNSMGQSYVGGPFFEADTNSVVWISKKQARTPVDGARPPVDGGSIPSSPSSSMVQKAAGALVFNPPKKMQCDVEEYISARIGANNTTNLIQNLLGKGKAQVKDIDVTLNFTYLVTLKGDSFNITSMRPDVQVLGENPAEWIWLVKPFEVGNHTLILSVDLQVEKPPFNFKYVNVTKWPVIVEVKEQSMRERIENISNEFYVRIVSLIAFLTSLLGLYFLIKKWKKGDEE